MLIILSLSSIILILQKCVSVSYTLTSFKVNQDVKDMIKEIQEFNKK